MIRPSGNTTSKPKTKFRVIPYFITFTPPAFVAIQPPIRALPRAPKPNGKYNPRSRATSCTCSKMAPACTCIARLYSSTSSTWSIRSKLITTSPSSDTVAPVSPVNPPCTTIRCRCAWQMAQQRATSDVETGNTTQSALKGTSIFQICAYLPSKALPANTRSGPNASINCLTIVCDFIPTR